MRNLLITSLLTIGFTTAMAAGKMEAGKYTVDPMHSKVGFEIPHLVIATVEGKFKTFTGTLVLDDKFEKSKLNAEVDISSIDTSVTDRDNHLKSPDFFDAAKYPKMTFVSTAISGKPEAFKLTGDLTIKDKTKSVVFETKYLGSVKDAYGNMRAIFEGSTKISRKEFGLSWSKMVEAGPVVGDQVTILLKIDAAKDKPEAKK